VRRRRRIPRRIERALLAPLMSIVAFLAERRLLKQLRRGGRQR
jgi:hypothetical protein